MKGNNGKGNTSNSFDMSERYYYFMNRRGIYKIPHNARVRLIAWKRHRHVLIEYNGEEIRSMGTLLRKRPSGRRFLSTFPSMPTCRDWERQNGELTFQETMELLRVRNIIHGFKENGTPYSKWESDNIVDASRLPLKVKKRIKAGYSAPSDLEAHQEWLKKNPAKLRYGLYSRKPRDMTPPPDW